MTEEQAKYDRKLQSKLIYLKKCVERKLTAPSPSGIFHNFEKFEEAVRKDANPLTQALLADEILIDLLRYQINYL